MQQHCLVQLENFSREIEMKEQEQALEKIKNNCHSMPKKIEGRMDNESAGLLTTMQLRLEVNESYIMKQKKMIKKMKAKIEQLEEEALEKTEASESERCWMNRSEVYAQTGGFLYLPSKGGGGYD